ncbi:MAG: 3-deoxy-7-phosphoheptulonate synthase [Candidatus Thermoplasmatota archaeon]|nr:3-deoxy-7-phosphoheptulonate synthase [Candidatus Thermoplasmatota archaeon]
MKHEGIMDSIFGESQKFIMIAGPCAVESLDQIMVSAMELSSLGIPILRAEIFKPRTDPDSFQGVGRDGLDMIKKVKSKTGIAVVTEVMDPDELDGVEEVADIIQIGSRNSQNFSLLKKVGRSSHPILLKRGFGNTIEEFIQSSRYISAQGNRNIIMVERGIRTFEDSLRFTLDIGAIPVLHERVKFPVLVDPSHPAGKSRYVEPLSLSGVGAGADGLMIEVHPDPPAALSDRNQQLNFVQFRNLLEKIDALLSAMGKERIMGREIKEDI